MHGTKSNKGLVNLGKITQSFETTMPSRRFARSQYRNSLVVLTEDQLEQVFQENIDTFSYKEIKKMFTFFLERGMYGRVRLSQSPATTGTTSETSHHNIFIMVQMIRFGFINKLKLK